MSGPKRSYNQTPISQALQFNPRQASLCKWLPHHAALRPKKTGRKAFLLLTHASKLEFIFKSASSIMAIPPHIGKRWLQYGRGVSATCAICSPSLSWLSLVALLELPMMGQSARSRPSAIPGQATKVLPKPGALCLKSGPKLKAARPLKEMAGYLNFQTFKPNQSQIKPKGPMA